MKIKINKLKNFENSYLSTSGINVYGGINGSGKSTLLKIVSRIYGLSQITLDTAINNEFNKIIKHFDYYEDEFRLEWKNLLKNHEEYIDEFNDNISTLFEKECHIQSGLFQDFVFRDRNEKVHELEEKKNDEERAIKKKCKFFKENFLVPGIEELHHNYIKQRIKMFNIGLNCENDELNYEVGNLIVENGKFNILGEKLLNFKDDKIMILKNYSFDKYEEVKYDEKDITFENLQFCQKISEYLDSEFDLTLPGFRSKRLNKKIKTGDVAMGMYIFKRICDCILKGNITSKTIMILDEPDCHLHPNWQFKLSEVLKMIHENYGCEIHIATHSALLIECLGSYDSTSIFHLDVNDSGYVNIKNIDGSDDLNPLLMELSYVYTRI